MLGYQHSQRKTTYFAGKGQVFVVQILFLLVFTISNPHSFNLSGSQRLKEFSIVYQVVGATTVNKSVFTCVSTCETCGYEELVFLLLINHFGIFNLLFRLGSKDQCSMT